MNFRHFLFIAYPEIYGISPYKGYNSGVFYEN